MGCPLSLVVRRKSPSSPHEGHCHKVSPRPPTLATKGGSLPCCGKGRASLLVARVGVPHFVAGGVLHLVAREGRVSHLVARGRGVPHLVARGGEASLTLWQGGGPPPCGKGGGVPYLANGGVPHFVARGEFLLLVEKGENSPTPSGKVRLKLSSMYKIARTRCGSPPHKCVASRGIGPPYMRFAEHLTALRAWRTQCLPSG